MDSETALLPSLFTMVDSTSTRDNGTVDKKTVAISTSHIQPFLFVKSLDMCTALSVKALNIHLLKHEQIEVSTDVVFS